MAKCITCHSELTGFGHPCPSCGSLPRVSTGTQATIALENGSLAAAPTPAPKSRTSSSSAHLWESSIPDDGRFLPGTLVNSRYRIVGLLGRGGMGEVYRATDLTLAQAVALKFLPESGVSERVLERFHAEVRIARQVSHPNVCRVYDIGEVEGLPFISMEYVDGEDLACLLLRIGRLPANKALETARKICAGLAAAHDKGVIHRDLKPQNIMLNRRGEPVIMDFGLAAVTDQITGAESRNGTPAYMSPEQLRGDEVTARSDIYALGLVLYEIFSGNRAYEANTVADLIKLQEGAKVLSLTSIAADIDPLVEKVIRRCLSPEPNLRPANPAAVAAALPGGDPLAAALAAGETPSPELVAASGKTEGMDLRYSIPMALFIFVILIALPLIYSSKSVLQRTPVSFPPVVIGYQARNIAASFGYTQAPADSLVSYTNGSGPQNYFQTHDRKGKSWDNLLAAEPFYDYLYRESPEPLLALPDGEVTATNPAPTVAGMLGMRLGFNGHLREFTAIPPESLTGASAPDPAIFFQATGFDPAGFTETTPQVIPMVAFDQRRAWKGPVPGLPGVDARIEAATLANRVTALKVIFPWTQAKREPRNPVTGAALVGPIGSIIVQLVGILFGLIFAVRNLRKNRADRNGAFLLALGFAILVMIMWVGTSHHVASPQEWSLFSNAVGEAAWESLALWILYLALEPAVRSRWPQSLVTWNRLLAARFGDAQLSAHILTGAAVGLILHLVLSSLNWIDYQRDSVPFANNLDGTESALSWIGVNAQTLTGALFSGFIVFFTIFGLRALWKNDYAAAFTTAVLFAVIANGGFWTDSSTNLLLERFLLLLIFAVFALILLRMGMVSSVATIFFLNTSTRINIGPRFNGWYTPCGLATMAMLMAITAYAFWRSVGARTIGDDVDQK